MRSLTLKFSIAAGAALALAGCLVSEEPLLDEKTGKAKPLGAGEHVMCPLSAEADDSDCERFVISVDGTGLYNFANAENAEDDAKMRFRRIGRRGYAVQAHEEDGAMYYYGRGDKKQFFLTMMDCASLSPKTRDGLIESGDLEADESGFTVCEVKSLDGLIAAARDYHRGRAAGNDEEIVLELTPATD